MKKMYIMLVCITLLGLTGCSNSDVDTSTQSNNLEVEEIQKLLSASDVKEEDEYYFAVSNEIITGMDTYSLNGTLNVVANDDAQYNLYYSTKEITDKKDLTPVIFKGETTVNVEGTTYFLLEKDTDNAIDVVISVL